MLRGVNIQTNVKIDINGITDFQDMPEYNKELGIFIFESDIFIN